MRVKGYIGWLTCCCLSLLLGIWRQKLQSVSSTWPLSSGVVKRTTWKSTSWPWWRLRVASGLSRRCPEHSVSIGWRLWIICVRTHHLQVHWHPRPTAKTLRELCFRSLQRLLGFSSGERHPEGFWGFSQFSQSLQILSGTETCIETQRSKIFLLHLFNFRKWF